MKNMKNLYATPRMEMVCIENTDVLTASPIEMYGSDGVGQVEKIYSFSDIFKK